MAEAVKSKMEAVRKALAELGKNAQPLDIQKHIKEKFGLDMTPAHISNYKTSIIGKRRGKKAAKASAANGEAKPMSAGPVKAASHKASAGITLHDIETVKGLVNRLSQHDLKSLIEVLGK